MPNAVQYAEQTLDVHNIYVETETAISDHRVALDKMTKANKAIRSLEEELRLAEISANVDATRQANSGQFPNATERNRYIKDLVSTNKHVVDIRCSIEDHKNERDEAEADVRHLALVIQARSARMTELGGLLNFYAAAKLVNKKED